MKEPRAWAAPFHPGPVDAAVRLPGSKSLTNRYLVLAALGEEPARIHRPLIARDTVLMARGLAGMGAALSHEGRTLTLTPGPLGSARIQAGLAGTVMRFIPAVAAFAVGDVTVDGDPAARTRPMDPVVRALRDLGVEVEHAADASGRAVLPVTVHGTGSVGGGSVEIDASASSQFVSALLLLGALLPGGLELTPTGPVPSLTHVAMTVATLRERGIAVDEPSPGAGDGERTWRVHPSHPRGGQVAIEPDLSNAGPFLAAALVAGGRVSVPHWPAATTQAGDAWRELLPRLGGEVTLSGELLTARGTGRLTGITTDLSDVGELVPTVAALATLAGAQGHASTLTGIAHLRGHETDRLAALATEIRLLGGDAEETTDGLIIRPAPLHGAALHSYADHRMATFAAIIGLGVDGVRLDDVECTSKTLPGFVGLWAAMLATADRKLSAAPGSPGVPGAGD